MGTDCPQRPITKGSASVLLGLIGTEKTPIFNPSGLKGRAKKLNAQKLKAAPVSKGRLQFFRMNEHRHSAGREMGLGKHLVTIQKLAAGAALCVNGEDAIANG